MSANVAVMPERLRELQRGAVFTFYHTHEVAEEAICDLQSSGFNLRKLSIVTTGERMKAWGNTEAFWNGLWGTTFGGAFFLVPPTGPLFVAGPLVGWIGIALEGEIAVEGLSALGVALYSIGVPEESIFEYESRIKNGNVLVIAHGSQDGVSAAR